MTKKSKGKSVTTKEPEPPKSSEVLGNDGDSQEKIDPSEKYSDLIDDVCGNGGVYTALTQGDVVLDERYAADDTLLAMAWIELYNSLAKSGVTIYPTDNIRLNEAQEKTWKTVNEETLKCRLAVNSKQNAAFLTFIHLLTLNSRNRQHKPKPLELNIFDDIIETLPIYLLALQEGGLLKEKLVEMGNNIEKIKRKPPGTEAGISNENHTRIDSIACELRLTGREKPVNTKQETASSQSVSDARSINRGSPPTSISAEEIQPLLAPASAGNFNFRRIGQYILAGSAASIFVGAVTVIGAVAGAGLIGGLITAGTLGMGLPLGIAIGGMAGAAVGAVSGGAITGIVMAVAYFWKRPGGPNPGGGGGSKNNSNQEPDSMVSSHAQVRSRLQSADVSKEPTQTRQNQADVQRPESDAKSRKTKKIRGETSSSRNAPRF